MAPHETNFYNKVRQVTPSLYPNNTNLSEAVTMGLTFLEIETPSSTFEIRTGMFQPNIVAENFLSDAVEFRLLGIIKDKAGCSLDVVQALNTGSVQNKLSSIQPSFQFFKRDLQKNRSKASYRASDNPTWRWSFRCFLWAVCDCHCPGGSKCLFVRCCFLRGSLVSFDATKH